MPSLCSRRRNFPASASRDVTLAARCAWFWSGVGPSQVAAAAGFAAGKRCAERRWLLAWELHSYFIRKLLKNPLSPARRSNFHRKVVLWQRLLSSDLAAERSSPRRYAAFPPRTTLGGNPSMPRK